MRVEIAATPEEFARRAADAFCGVIRAKPAAALGLASGKTPLGLLAELERRIGRGEIDLTQATAFAIDELHGVPREHPATNATYFRRELSGVPLRALYVMDSEAPEADEECARFLRRIAEAGGLDLVVLGIGTNGHLAFNEPGSPFDSRARKVALERSSSEPYAPLFGSLEATPAFGLTLGIADLLAAPRALLLAGGADKAEAVASAFDGPVTETVPASALQRHANLTVVLDRAAASRLRHAPS